VPEVQRADATDSQQQYSTKYQNDFVNTFHFSGRVRALLGQRVTTTHRPVKLQGARGQRSRLGPPTRHRRGDVRTWTTRDKCAKCQRDKKRWARQETRCHRKGDNDSLSCVEICGASKPTRGHRRSARWRTVFEAGIRRDSRGLALFFFNRNGFLL